MHRPRTLAAALAGLAILAVPRLAAQDDPPARAQLDVERIVVEPARPGPETLCRLRVTLRNRGTEKASQLAFQVKLNGEELGVYGNQLFMYAVDPGSSAEIPLYNFWTTETSRPAMPGNGKFVVEVALTEAEWMKVEMEGDVEVWTPLGAVPGLPAGSSVTLDAARP